MEREEEFPSPLHHAREDWLLKRMETSIPDNVY